MNSKKKLQTEATNESALPDASEPHHGDLRKRAYLKRRAAYRMQEQWVPDRALHTKRRGPA